MSVMAMTVDCRNNTVGNVCVHVCMYVCMIVRSPDVLVGLVNRKLNAGISGDKSLRNGNDSNNCVMNMNSNSRLDECYKINQARCGANMIDVKHVSYLFFLMREEYFVFVFNRH